MAQTLEARGQNEPNPLARLADAIPANAALAVSLVARLVGAAALIYYAYDQDVLFPGRHFPRTWVFAGSVAGISLLSILPMLTARKPGMMIMLASLGGGVLIFGGANLATRAPGVVALAAGILAWTSYSAVAHQRAGKAEPIVSGLLLGSLLSYALIAVCVFLVPN